MLRRLLVLTVGILIFTFCATADIVPALQSGPTPIGSEFLYVYQADVSGVERLDPAATNGSTCSGSPCNPAGTFFTLYDVGGLDAAATMASSLPSGWGLSIQLIGLTPSGVSLTESPTVANVTFEYTGPVVHGPVTITGFDVFSTVDTLALGKYSSQATINSVDPLTNGTTDFASGSVSLPAVPASAVPEPASMAVLLGGGMMGLALVRKRFTRQ